MMCVAEAGQGVWVRGLDADMWRDGSLFLVLLCRRAYVSRNDMLTG